VLAVLGRHHRVLTVELIGRGDPDDVDLRIDAQLLHTAIGAPLILALECFERAAAAVGRSRDPRVRELLDTGQEQRARDSEPGDAEPQDSRLGPWGAHHLVDHRHAIVLRYDAVRYDAVDWVDFGA